MKLYYICIALSFYFFGYILSEQSIAETANFRFPVVYLIILFTTFIMLLIRKVKITLTKKQCLFFLVSFLVYVFIPLITFNVTKFNKYDNIINVFFDLTFILVIIIISSQMNDKFKYYKMLQAVAVGNGLYIFVSIITNFNQLINIDNYMWLADVERLARATYGLRHPNMAGMILLVEFYSLLYCLLHSKLVKLKVTLILIEVVLLLALISTGNRTACYAILLSFICGFVLVIMRKLSKRLRVLIIVYSIVVVTAYLLFVFNWNNFYASTNSLAERFSTMRSTLHYVPEMGNYFVGTAPIDNIGLSTDYLFLRIDNWFVQTLVLYGVLGLLLMLILILYLLFIELKNYLNNGDGFSLFRIVLFVSELIYSTMENTLFNHGYSWSLFLWLLILPNVNKKNIKNDILKKSNHTL
jgi:O-antigen ligase